VTAALPAWRRSNLGSTPWATIWSATIARRARTSESCEGSPDVRSAGAINATISQPATTDGRTLCATSYNADVPQDPPRPQQLDRRLGPIDAAAIVISNVIGVGIFIAPGIIHNCASPPVSGVGLVEIGICWATGMPNSTLRPRGKRPPAGGPAPRGLTGWISFVAGFAGAVLQALGRHYLGRFACGGTQSGIHDPGSRTAVALSPAPASWP
jgi:hypothetical protein